MYHQVVRDQMIRYLRIRSKENWQNLHKKLSTWYEKLQDELKVEEEQQLDHKEWIKWELERIYHVLCENSDVHLQKIIPQIVRVWYVKWIPFSKSWAETILQVGKDVNDENCKQWGEQIEKSIIDRFVNHENKKNNSLHKVVDRFIQTNWLKNKDHLSFLYLIRGNTYYDQQNYFQAIDSYKNLGNPLR